MIKQHSFYLSEIQNWDPWKQLFKLNTLLYLRRNVAEAHEIG